MATMAFEIFFITILLISREDYVAQCIKIKVAWQNYERFQCFLKHEIMIG